MKLWRIPDSGDQDTEYIVRADTPGEAIAKCEASQVAGLEKYRAEHPEDTRVLTLEWYRGKPPLYDEIEEIIEDVYRVPFYGYSW